MSHFNTQCPNCKTQCRVPRDHLGTTIRCEFCGHVFLATSPATLVKVRCHKCGKAFEEDLHDPRSGDAICSSCGGKAANHGDAADILLAMLRHHRTQVIEDHEVVDTIHRGDFGNVYAARRRRDGRKVALKVMRSQGSVAAPALARFRREILLLRQLRHSQIVPLLEDGIAGDLVYFTMDYFEEGSLADLLEREFGRIPWREAVSMVIDLLPALEYAHGCKVSVPELPGELHKGVVHRDIKPHNLFIRTVNGRRTAWLADFGLAKAFEAAGGSGVTTTGTAGGSFPYMPPEQAIDFVHVEPVSDVWSISATLYRMIVGVPPRDSAAGLSEWQVVGECPAVPIRERDPSVPQELAAVIDRGLALNVDDRIQTAEELRLRLHAAIHA
jgi:predicted Zn finger-like uncharacterized protein